MTRYAVWMYDIPACPKCGSRIWVRVSHDKWKCIVCGYEMGLEWKVKKQ
jgi:ribosomal protein L37AE/L43A